MAIVIKYVNPETLKERIISFENFDINTTIDALYNRVHSVWPDLSSTRLLLNYNNQYLEPSKNKTVKKLLYSH